MVSEHLRIRNQKWLLYEYLKTTFCFFGNAIWGLCRCNFLNSNVLVLGFGLFPLIYTFFFLSASFYHGSL